MEHWDVQGPLVSAIITWVITSIFVYFAARWVADRPSFIAALLSTLIGSFLAGLIGVFLGGTLGLVLGLAAYALVIAIFYRTSWIKGAIIGLVAGVLYIIVRLIIDAVL